MSEKRRTMNKLIGRIGNEFYVLDGTFEYKDGFRGVTGSSFSPVTQAMRDEQYERKTEYLEEHWQMAVEGGHTQDGLEEWAENYVREVGDEAFWDLSYSALGEMVAEQYNKELPADHAPEDEAEFAECTGGGRMFEPTGIRGVKWEDFDVLYADKETLAIIADYETEKPKPKIVKGTVTIDGVLYKAFENSISGSWYIVKGEKSSGEKVAKGIEAKSGKKALEQWLASR